MKLIKRTNKKSLRKPLLRIIAATMLLHGATSVINAQNVDGRNFGIDGFAAVAGNEGTVHYREGGTTGGEGGKTVYANTLQQLQAYLQAKAPYVIIVDHDMTQA